MTSCRLVDSCRRFGGASCAPPSKNNLNTDHPVILFVEATVHNFLSAGSLISEECLGAQDDIKVFKIFFFTFLMI